MNKLQSNAGAIASNAGDDFHILWAAKKILGMLNPASTLVGLSVEGPNANDISTNMDGNTILSIDVAEYHGGSEFSSATEVIFSQLKYSTYQGNDTWSVSDLCKNTNKQMPNSIIRRLAQTYQGYKKDFSDIEKLTIKLVSNRAISKRLHTSIALAKQTDHLTTKQLLDRLPLENQADIKQLYNSSKLASKDFVKFIKAFDISDCDIDTRMEIKLWVIKQLGSWGFDKLQTCYDTLTSYVRSRMLPDMHAGKIITQDDVYAILNTKSYRMLPAPANLPDLPYGYIHRRHTKELADEIIKEDNRPIFVHSSGGFGKSTLVQNIKQNLPEGSIVILYDCYGGGTYLNPDKPRHTTETMSHQISNSLAFECQTELLLASNLKDSDYWRELNDRLINAVNCIKQLHPDGIAAIIIDAADNSIAAAKQSGANYFLDKLLNVPIPPGAKLIITCRTEHLDYFNYTHGKRLFEVKPFSKEESIQHFKLVYPQANDKVCEQFHNLTQGNPRVQSYALKHGGTSVNDTLAVLLPNGKTLDNIFDDLLHEAIQRTGMPAKDFKKVFNILAKLPRPIPQHIALSISGLLLSELQSICADLFHGIYIDQEELYFRDEDFEAFINRTISDEKSIDAHIQAYLYDHRMNDHYCAQYLHLFLAGQENLDRLIHISIDELIPKTLIEVTEINRIMLERIKFALKSVQDGTHPYVACKLLFRSIDFIKTNEAIEKLISSNPELSRKYCSTATLVRVFEPFADNSHLDSLADAAYVFSYCPNLHEHTRALIKKYEYALQDYFEKSEDDRHTPVFSRPTKNNIARIAEAILRLNNAKDAYEYICGWNIGPEVLSELVYSLLVQCEDKLVDSLLLLRWEIKYKLAIIFAYIRIKRQPPTSAINDILDCSFEEVDILHKHCHIGDMLSFLEFLAEDSQNDGFIKALLKNYVPNLHLDISNEFIYSDNEQQIDLSLRLGVLKEEFLAESFTVNEFMKVVYAKPVTEKSQKDDIKEKQIPDFIKTLLPVYRLRLQTICNSTINQEDLSNNISSFKRHYWVSHNYDHEGEIKLYTLALTDAILNTKTLTLTEVKTSLTKLAKSDCVLYTTKLALLERCSTYSRSHFFVLQSLQEIEDSIIDNPSSAGETSDSYCHFSKLVQVIDQQKSQEYFSKALSAAEQIDYESIHKLKYFRKLAQQAGKEMAFHDDKLAFNLGSYAEQCYYTLQDNRNFPFDQVFQSLSILSPQGIWSIACGLDDRKDSDDLSLENNLHTILNTLLEKNSLPPDITASLCGLLLPDYEYAYSSIINLIIEKLKELDKSKQEQVMAVLARDALYEVPMLEQKYYIAKISSLISEKSYLQTPSFIEVNKLNGFFKTIPAEENYTQTYVDKRPYIEDLNLYYTQHPILNKVQLLAALKDINKNSQLEFIDLILSEITPEECVPRTQMIFESCLEEHNLIASEKILSLVCSRVGEWDVVPSFKAWRCNREVAEKYFCVYNDLLTRPHYSFYESFVKLFSLEESAHINLLLQKADGYLYSIDHAVDLAQRILTHSSSQIAQFLLNELIASEKSKHNINPSFSELYHPSDDIIVELSHFLWRLLGHPKKSLRWKAVHSILRLINCGYENLVDNLIQLFNKPLEQRFMDEGNYFFIDSAKIWLLLACNRIIKDYPGLLAKHYSFFKSIACAQDAIHALQRRLARHISLKIAEAAFREDISELLESDSIVADATATSHSCRYSDKHAEIKTNFYFNDVDTITYWYAELADIFACSKQEIALNCDPFVTKMGITTESARLWRETYLKRFKLHEISNMQGGIPSIETLSKYAEWHSMFYVADKYRLTRSTTTDPDHSYHDWLDSYIPDYWGYLSCEFRDHTPCVPFFWNFDRMVDLKRKEYIIPESLSEELFNIDSKILLALDYYSTANESYRWIHIKSGFIAAKKSTMLVSKMKRTAAYLNRFFYEPDFYNGYREQLQPIVVPSISFHNLSRDNSLDYHDLLIKEADATSYVQPNIIIEYLKLNERPYVLLLPTLNRNLPARIISWSEPGKESDYEKRSTSGRLFEIEKEILLEFINKYNLIFIAETDIKFEDSQQRHYNTQYKSAVQRKLLLLEPNGTVSEHNMLCDE